MAIDLEMRRSGVSASDVAGILNLSPYHTAFDVYLVKRGEVTPPKSTVQQRRGHLMEPVIIQMYMDATGKEVEYFDKTIRNASRPWQLCSPDAWIIERGAREAELQCKSANYRAREHWGDPGGDDVPIHISLQAGWTMSCCDTAYTAIATMFSMDEIGIYTVYRDREVEALILEECQRFWFDNVLAGVPPEISDSALTREYIRHRFPSNISALRLATPEEQKLLAEFRQADETKDAAEHRREELANRVKISIAEADGLLDGGNKVLYRRCADSKAPDWQAIARELLEDLAAHECPTEAEISMWIAKHKAELIERHMITVKAGGRRLIPTWSRK